jgi:hypothetical protein
MAGRSCGQRSFAICDPLKNQPYIQVKREHDGYQQFRIKQDVAAERV